MKLVTWLLLYVVASYVLVGVWTLLHVIARFLERRRFHRALHRFANTGDDLHRHDGCGNVAARRSR